MITAAVITSKYPLEKSFLESLNFADEIVIIVDQISKIKNTLNKKIRVYNHQLNNDFAGQRNFALSKAKPGWVFFIDDDEYIGKELAAEILQAVQSDKYSGYFLKREDSVYHQLLSHGETGDIKLVRLAKKDAGKWVRPVHEIWNIKGGVGELSTTLYHIKDHFVSGFLGRISNYGKIDSEILSIEGKPFSFFRLFLNPVGKFFLNYFIKAGFLDGDPGLFQSYLMAIQSLSVRVFQWENKK